MNKVSLSFSQVGCNTRAFTSLGMVLLTVGLVSSCGDDDPGGTGAQSDAGTTTTSGTTTTANTTTTASGTTTDTTTTASGTTTDTGTTTSTIELTTDPGAGTSTDTISTDTTAASTTGITSDTDVSTSTDEPEATNSECGGAGQPCCDVLACDPGMRCVGVDAVNDSGPGGDNNDGDLDAGVMPLEAGMFNLLADASVDAGEQEPFVPSVDAGEQEPFVPLPIDASTTNGGFAVEAGTTAPVMPVGMCEPCGGEGEQCCADDACGEGLSCNMTGFGPNMMSSCETVVPPEGDGGDDNASCGTLGTQCCPGAGGSCEDGLECENGSLRGLSDSECVSAAAESDSGLR